MPEIDQLRIQINSNATNARSSIKGLASDVRTLSNGAGSAAGKLDALASSLGKIGAQQNAVNTTKGLANAVEKLNGVRISSNIANQLERLSSAVAKMGNVGALNNLAAGLRSLQNVRITSTTAKNLSAIADSCNKFNSVQIDTGRITSLVNGLSQLSSVPKNNLSSTVKALKQLPEAVNALHSSNLTQFAEEIKQLTNAMGMLPAKAAAVKNALNGAASGNRSFSSSAGSATSATNREATAFEKLAHAAYTVRNVSTIWGAAVGYGHALAYVVDQANKYIEDMNLFNVAMGNYADQARNYANQVSAVMGIEPQEWMRDQGTFDTMAQGMGIVSDKAATMSQQLTQLSYDLASYYNLSTADAFEKVQAGLAGQIRPLRELGFDLSDARLKEEAMAMGIQENTDSMTQSEKAMLRYRAMLTQVSWAQGDMARTLDSPANALRVFKSNLHQAAVSIGTAFLPMLKAILPLATAAAKAVATLGNMLANLTGGTQIASTNYGGGGNSGGGGGAAVPADTGTGGSGGGSSPKGSGGGNPTAKKYNDIGDAAKKATEKVKELKREVLSFDEINKFSPQPDTGSSGSGSGGKSPSSGRGSGGKGSGGSGGSGGGGAGLADMPIQTYDFLGNATNQFDGLYNQIMAFVKRALSALAPLAEAIGGFLTGLKKQFDGLDILGAAENAFMGFLNLVSNVARGVVEVLGPMILAFNFPDKIALSFDLAAQMCLTLSAAINDVSTFLNNFVNNGLVQFVAWIGQNMSGAIELCITELSNWQSWFESSLQTFANLGRAAGDGAAQILNLAMALGQPIFDTIAAVFSGINYAMRELLGVLINSNMATIAVTNLGRAFSVWLIGKSISTGLDLISTAFNKMSEAIFNSAVKAESSSKGLADTLSGGLPSSASKARSAIGNLKASIELLGEAKGFHKLSSSSSIAGNSIALFRNKIDGAVRSMLPLANQEQILANRETLLKQRSDLVTRSYENHKKSLTDAFNSARQLASQNSQNATVQGRLAQAIANANVKIEAGKTQMDVSRMASAGMSQSAIEAAASEAGVGTSAGGAAMMIATGTVAKGAATIASKALAAAETLVGAAMDAIPGMALVTVIGLLVQALPGLVGRFTDWLSTLGPIGKGIADVVGKVTGFIGNLLGLDTNTGKVTDSTKKATKVLSEEQQQVKDNVESIKKYEKSHDDVKIAIDSTGKSEEDFAKKLQKSGMTFDDLKQKAEDYANSTVNSFDKIDTSGGQSLDDVNAALTNNNQVMQTWSNNVEGFAKYAKDHGVQNVDQMVDYIQQAGPEKMGNAMQQFMNDPTSQASQTFLQQLSQTASDADKKITDGLKSDQSEAKAKENGKKTSKAYADGVEEGSGKAKQSAKKTADDAAEGYSSGKEKAKSHGKAQASSYSDGVGSGKSNAKSSAKAVADSAVSGLGTGNAKAKTAGSSIMSSFSSGLSSGAKKASSTAKSVATSVASSLRGGQTAARSAGAAVMSSFSSGLSSGTSRARSVARSTASSVASGLRNGSGTARSAGAVVMNAFASGLTSRRGAATSAARAAASGVASGMMGGTGSAHSAGASVGNAFANGVRSASGNAFNAGRSVAKSATSGMSGANGYYSGWNAGIGLANGLWDSSWKVYDAAYTIAHNVSVIMNSALDVGSPSKLTRKTGGFASEGLGLGILDKVSFVERASRTATDAVLGTEQELGDRGRRLGNALGSGFGNGVSSAVSTVDALARSYTGNTYRASYSVSPAGYSSGKDNDLVSDVARAVELGVLSARMSASSNDPASQGDTTIVLRLGDEDVARASIRGQDSLARRGVIRLD